MSNLSILDFFSQFYQIPDFNKNRPIYDRSKHAAKNVGNAEFVILAHYTRTSETYNSSYMKIHDFQKEKKNMI